VDLDPRVRADERWDVRYPKVKPRTVVELSAHHVLEHVAVPEAKTVLASWVALLAPCGQINLTVPDVHDLTRRLAEGEIDVDAWRRYAFAWTSGITPEGWVVPDGAATYHNAQRLSDRARYILRTAGPLAFVDWFNERLFAPTRYEPDWYWVHKSAYSKESLATDLRNLGLSVVDCHVEGMSYAVVRGRAE